MFEISGVVGEENIKPGAKERVIRLLADLPLPASTRRYFYGRWTQAVGISLDAVDLDRVGTVPSR